MYSVYSFVLSFCEKSSAPKPKVPISGPVTSYIQKRAACSNRPPILDDQTLNLLTW